MSHSYDKTFPNNTRFKFSTSLDSSTLDYLPSGEIECAVKSITIDCSRDFRSSHLYQCFGLKSNLIQQESLSSGKYEKILCLLHVEKYQKILHTDFQNPTFFITSKELISKASFELVDIIKDKSTLKLEGKPTIIHIVVKQQHNRMKPPFQINLDSSCKISKEYFPSNTNMNFTVQLPKRLQFSKQWSVALKYLSYTNSIVNVFDCWIRVTTREGIIIIQRIKDDHYSSTKDLFKEITKEFTGPLKPYLSISSLDDSRIKIVKQGDNVDTVEFSNNLRRILKLSNHAFSSETDTSTVSIDSIDMYELVPQHVVVCCNIVQNSLLGIQQLPVLKFTTLPKVSGSIINHEFLFTDYLHLKLKDFQSITIQLMDTEGNPLRCKSNIPTRLQLLFVNTNSS